MSIAGIFLAVICFIALAILIQDDWDTYRNKKYILSQPLYYLLGLIGVLSLII